MMPLKGEIQKSKITLLYKSILNETPTPTELPFRLIVFGDMSKGSSTDRKVSFPERDLRNFDGENTSNVIRDMHISVDLYVPNKIDPMEEELVHVPLPIEDIHSFNPEKIVENIPKAQALLKVKQLLVEGFGFCQRVPAFIKALHQVYSNPDRYNALREQLSPLAALKIEKQSIDINSLIKVDNTMEHNFFGKIKTKEEKLFTPFIQALYTKKNDHVVEVDSVCESIGTLKEKNLCLVLGSLIHNIEPDREFGTFDKAKIQEIIKYIDQLIENQINAVLHNDNFQEIEASWRGVFDLICSTDFRANIMIDMIDASKEELIRDLKGHTADFTQSATFRKMYDREYDQYGGKPYGLVLGLYQTKHTPEDEMWLSMMGKICALSHAPFITSVSPQFFGCNNIEELANIKDLEGHMNQPKYGSFNALRDSEEAAYIGLSLPSYVLRLPWDPVTNPCGNFNFVEHTWGDNNKDYLWGNSAILFAKNLIKSFESWGWCQYIRGPKGGGLIKGLPVHSFNIRGEDEIKIPVEMTIPDHRELEFANCGFMPLVYQKGTGNACFFSAQSLKRPEKFCDPVDSENSQIACNLSYTFSISRIAHYVRCIVRDNIGSSSDADYIEKVLNGWILDYVKLSDNLDNPIIERFPFKSASIKVKERPDKIGFYDAKIRVKPHVQMEGIDIELQTDSRLY